MQILLTCFTTTHATDDDVTNDVVQYDYCEYGEQGLQTEISHAYFCIVSAFFVSHVNTLKQNWNKTISLKQNIVLRLFCFSFVSVLYQL